MQSAATFCFGQGRRGFTVLLSKVEQICPQVSLGHPPGGGNYVLNAKTSKAKAARDEGIWHASCFMGYGTHQALILLAQKLIVLQLM